MLAYGASKFVVVGMTQTAAKDLAPYGIRVNAISPALIGPGTMWDRQTELQAANRTQYFAPDPQRVQHDLIASVPLRRRYARRGRQRRGPARQRRIELPHRLQRRGHGRHLRRGRHDERASSRLRTQGPTGVPRVAEVGDSGSSTFGVHAPASLTVDPARRPWHSGRAPRHGSPGTSRRRQRTFGRTTA